VHKNGNRQLLQDVELGFIRQHLPRRRGCSALELGCGTGRLTAKLIQRFGKYVGLDMSPKMLSICRKKFRGRKFVRHDISRRFPFPGSYFDVVYGLRVVKYSPNLQFSLKEVSRILKPNGTFIFDMPNLWSLTGIPRYSFHMSRVSESDLKRNLSKAGFTDVDIDYGPKLPDIIYAAEFMAPEVLLLGERTLNRIFSKAKFSRTFYICAKKKPV
jgi:SAM-dependent methyltransferase